MLHAVIPVTIFLVGGGNVDIDLAGGHFIVYKGGATDRQSHSPLLSGSASDWKLIKAYKLEESFGMITFLWPILLDWPHHN